MSDFKAEMHQIQFRLLLLTRPCWGSLQRSLTLSCDALLLRGREGRREGREGEGREGRDGGEREGMRFPTFSILL